MTKRKTRTKRRRCMKKLKAESGRVRRKMKCILKRSEKGRGYSEGGNMDRGGTGKMERGKEEEWERKKERNDKEDVLSNFPEIFEN